MLTAYLVFLASSSKNRTSALSYIDKIFCQKIVSDFLTGRWALILLMYCCVVVKFVVLCVIILCNTAISLCVMYQ